jgi:hypothetical protein
MDIFNAVPDLTGVARHTQSGLARAAISGIYCFGETNIRSFNRFFLIITSRCRAQFIDRGDLGRYSYPVAKIPLAHTLKNRNQFSRPPCFSLCPPVPLLLPVYRQAQSSVISQLLYLVGSMSDAHKD